MAGVIGTSKFVYDLWGDAVNVASRLETSAPPGRIQVSEPIAAALGGAFELEPRGDVELKGKGATRVLLPPGSARRRRRRCRAGGRPDRVTTGRSRHPPFSRARPTWP